MYPTLFFHTLVFCSISYSHSCFLLWSMIGLYGNSWVNLASLSPDELVRRGWYLVSCCSKVMFVFECSGKRIAIDKNGALLFCSVLFCFVFCLFSCIGRNGTCCLTYVSSSDVPFRTFDAAGPDSSPTSSVSMMWISSNMASTTAGVGRISGGRNYFGDMDGSERRRLTHGEG